MVEIYNLYLSVKELNLILKVNWTLCEIFSQKELTNRMGFHNDFLIHGVF